MWNPDMKTSLQDKHDLSSSTKVTTSAIPRKEYSIISDTFSTGNMDCDTLFCSCSIFHCILSQYGVSNEVFSFSLLSMIESATVRSLSLLAGQCHGILRPSREHSFFFVEPVGDALPTDSLVYRYAPAAAPVAGSRVI